MKYIFVSTNKKKYEEFRYLFPESVIFEKMDIKNIIGTVEENARARVAVAYEDLRPKYGSDIMVITDNASLEVHELNCFPGMLLHDFMSLGFHKLEMMMKEFDTRSTLNCVLGVKVYCQKRSILIATEFSGVCKGRLVFGRKASNDDSYGFDSIFLLDGSPDTFGEMSFKEKSVLSHRSRAVFKLIKFCVENDLIENKNNDTL